MLTILLLMMFPQIALWLPQAVHGDSDPRGPPRGPTSQQGEKTMTDRDRRRPRRPSERILASRRNFLQRAGLGGAAAAGGTLAAPYVKRAVRADPVAPPDLFRRAARRPCHHAADRRLQHRRATARWRSSSTTPTSSSRRPSCSARCRTAPSTPCSRTRRRWPRRSTSRSSAATSPSPPATRSMWRRCSMYYGLNEIWAGGLRRGRQRHLAVDRRLGPAAHLHRRSRSGASPT